MTDLVSKLTSVMKKIIPLGATIVGFYAGLQVGRSNDKGMVSSILESPIVTDVLGSIPFVGDVLVGDAKGVSILGMLGRIGDFAFVPAVLTAISVLIPWNTPKAVLRFIGTGFTGGAIMGWAGAITKTGK